MKKALITVLLVGVALFGIYGCAKVADTSGGGGGGSSTIGAITGTVTFINYPGTDLPPATVTITGVTSTAASNASGWFALGNIPATSSANMTITAAGYVTLRTTIDVVGGQTRHSNYTMAPANAAVTGLSAAATETLPLQNNASTTITSTLTIAANSLVSATAGTPYTGTYSVSLTPGDSTNTNEVDALFPGQFTGSSLSSGEVYIQSFGFMNVNATDSSGNPLNVRSNDSHALALAPGTTAQWKQEIPASQVASAPNTIDMWYFDEATNKWMQGRDSSGNPIVGTKVTEGAKAYYVGSINHFSTWNYDVSYPRAFISGRVVNSSLEAIVGAEVKCWGEGWTYRRWRSGETGTDSLGRFIEIAVETGKPFYLQATKGSQKSRIYSFGSYAANTITDVGDIVIEGGSTANIQMILTWGANPSDLDSHMTVPTTTGITTRGHVYYLAKGSASAYPYCWLDVDDTSSYGPEVTTVTRKLPGTYRFCIHNYSGQSSGPIESSSAKVEGFISGNYYVWNVPTTNSGNKNVWRVCDLVIDSAGNVTVQTLNDFADSSDTDGYNPVGALGVPSVTELQSLDKAKK
jgi:hypothetical protein